MQEKVNEFYSENPHINTGVKLRLKYFRGSSLKDWKAWKDHRSGLHFSERNTIEWISGKILGEEAKMRS